MFKKILIVNRGEIAVRIIKACREMGITSAAIYSDADKNSLHVRAADEAYHIGAAPANQSYLNIDNIIAKALEIGADAIHPGYGFLSENSVFIKKVKEAGFVFIGPSSRSVEMMGEKTAARKIMKKNNVPIVPGTTEPINDIDEAIKIAKGIGFPVMLKAAAGGGGKGMRKVDSEDKFREALERAQNESQKAFGNSDVYIEKFIENPKHIEVQIIADMHGNYAHLFERECSVQRRHQKVVEEAPSLFVDDETRSKITIAAIDAAKACNYFNAGTVEFLMDKDKNFYFLEMNTRLQVEHPVTEMITGIDLVKEQIRIANGEKLSFSQDEIKINGSAIECRIYAEDINNNFAPSTGKIIHHRLPSGPGIRVDRGIDLMTDVPVYYDPMLAKVITWGKDRDEAIARMERALGEYQVAGVITNISGFKWILNRQSFRDGTFDINFIENEFMPLVPYEWEKEISKEYEDVVSIFAALLKDKESKLKTVSIDNKSNNHWNNQRYE
ncbi:MAG: acetyl-CoA carboxylase biotin carboxylase subunit [Melioribacteraceae bacterium]|nr:acetyl-CoA carboxylase biotin carboxylase subunit [Melioribacteraceae bacterium]MCF8352942.1 acetyl-CoA carboxylase biotin carboxylase subunit [Melioribacteraceae bacterium]MCF8395878.1 acetyl-CoA carboxylase biotin carboxylase subunit [Melioribacteraceae bacterium]MCF8417459.1 acetyl-CoA carboxylase biotin carboxylase subunit [Melioribacteraceae bacterium]